MYTSYYHILFYFGLALYCPVAELAIQKKIYYGDQGFFV